MKNSLTPLVDLSFPLKVLFSSYLVVIGFGLLMAFTQILLTHGMADGKFGLSVNDVIYSYYGNRGGSRLENKLNGSMKDKASVEKRAQIIEWVRKGSHEADWNRRIQPIFQENCVRCHTGIMGLQRLATYADVKPFAQVDMGASIKSLARVSHIHLFGIAFIFFFVCFIFAHAEGVPWFLQGLVICFPFAFLLVDIGSWWLTKWFPSAAYLTMFAGFGYALSSFFMVNISLYQMWWKPLRRKIEKLSLNN